MVDIHAIISLGRVLRLMATVHSTQYAFNKIDGRQSGDHQSWAGPPPDGHGPFDTMDAFNIMDGRHSCNHQSWAGTPPDGHGPLDTKSNPVDGLSRGNLDGEWDIVLLQFPGAEVSAAYRRARRYAPS